MRWQIISAQMSHAGREIIYDVECTRCKTIYFFTKSEIETEKCNCSRRANHCKKEKSNA